MKSICLAVLSDFLFLMYLSLSKLLVIPMLFKHGTQAFLNQFRLFPWFGFWTGCGHLFKLIIPSIIPNYSRWLQLLPIVWICSYHVCNRSRQEAEPAKASPAMAQPCLQRRHHRRASEGRPGNSGISAATVLPLHTQQPTSLRHSSK